MSTVIDSLVVSLGLDPKNFNEGQKSALAAFKKTQEEARKSATAFEESSQRIINGFSRARNEVVGFFGAAAGAYGVKQFIANLVTADAAIGRLSRTSGVGVDVLAKFGKAVELAGGAEGAGQQAISALANRIARFGKGEDAQLIAQYQALLGQSGGKKRIDPTSSPEQQFRDIAENAREAARRVGPAKAATSLQDIGINEDTINLMLRSDFRSLVDDAEKFANLTKRSTDLAESLLQKWRAIGQAVQGATRTPELVVGEAFDKFLDRRIAEEKRSPQERQTDANKKIDEMLARVRSFFGNDPFVNRMFGGSGAKGPAITPTESPWTLGNAGTSPGGQGGGKYFGGAFGGTNLKPLGWDFGAFDKKTEVTVTGPVTIYAPEATATAIVDSFKSRFEAISQRQGAANLANSGGQ